MSAECFVVATAKGSLGSAILKLDCPSRTDLIAGQIKIPYLIIRGGTEPHLSLRIDEKFSHRIFRKRNGVLDHLAGVRIETSHNILVHVGIPEASALIDCERVRAWAFAR